MSLTKKRVEGFTLIELMIVVAIIGILAAVAIPKFADLVTKSKEASTKGSLGAVRSATSIYYGETERYPGELFASLTNANKYMPSMAGTPSLGKWEMPGTAANHTGGLYANASAVGAVDADGTLDDETAIFYVPPGGAPANQVGEVYVGCTHNDTRGVAWSSY